MKYFFLQFLFFPESISNGSLSRNVLGVSYNLAVVLFYEYFIYYEGGFYKIGF